MKKLLVLLLSIPLLSHAQINFTKLSGKWQEVKRMEQKGKEIQFTDTVKMEIRPEGFIMIRALGKANISGQAQIDGDELLLKKMKWLITEFDEHHLIMKDDDGIHYFKKPEEIKLLPVSKLVPGIEKGKVNISFENIEGKWTSYRKTDPDFTREKFYMKSIDFIEVSGQYDFKGKVTFTSNDSVYFSKANIHAQDDELDIHAEKDHIRLKVLKSDGEEMILEDGSVHYFMKRFAKKEQK